jgi:hypothetical protein
MSAIIEEFNDYRSKMNEKIDCEIPFGNQSQIGVTKEEMMEAMELQP